MMYNPKYESHSCKEIIFGKEYTVTDYTPKLDKDEHQKVKRDIESKLYQIFKNYA